MANTTTNFLDSNGVDVGSYLVEKTYLLDRYPELADNLKQSGLWLWGRNAAGQLGNGTSDLETIAYLSPVQTVARGNDWKLVSVSLGTATSSCSVLAIKSNNTLWAWGLNGTAFGQLGLSDTVSRSSPVQVGSGTNWKQVSAGYPHTLAIKTDGTLWAWGSNLNYGQLGLGDFIHRSSPVQVGSGTNWKQVSAGAFITGGIKTDGSLWMWGINSSGQLGLGDRIHRSSPVQVGSNINWKQILVGGSNLLGAGALKTDGTIWSWGLNFYGELGLGDLVIRSSPVQIGSGTNWKLLSMGGYASAAIKTDGTLWAWGRNTAGQLGLGDITHRSSPVQVGSDTNWKQVAMSDDNCVLLRTDGTVWWLGNIAGSSSPVLLLTSTNWKSVTIGSNGFEKITFAGIRDSSEDLL